MKLVIFFLLLVSGNVYGQTNSLGKLAFQHDSTDLAVAINYLTTKFDRDFIKQHLIYQGHYQSVLHMVTFEITPQKSTNNKNMIIIFINGEEVETKYNTKINKLDITNYLEGLPSENLFFNLTYALQQAKIHKLAKGIKTWEAEIDGVADEVYWNVKSFSAETFNPMWQAKGSFLKLNAKTGETFKGEWHGVE